MQNKTTFKLGEPVSPRNARHILIATRPRCGSSFLGDLLSRYPGTFYSFEPLYFNRARYQNTLPPNTMIKQIFKCDQNEKYIEHLAKLQKAWMSFRLLNPCTSLMKNDKICYSMDYYNGMCPMFPIRLIKTVRLPIQGIEELLLDPELGNNLKIVYLVRDPRAVQNSLISEVKWCEPPCSINWLCKKIENEIPFLSEMERKYPGS